MQNPAGTRNPTGRNRLQAIEHLGRTLVHVQDGQGAAAAQQQAVLSCSGCATACLSWTRSERTPPWHGRTKTPVGHTHERYGLHNMGCSAALLLAILADETRGAGA